MLRIYDTDNTFITLVDRCKDACVTTVLETGLKTLSFKLPITDENLANIEEEYYIETEDYKYIVKEINMSTNDYMSIYCTANIEELKILIPTFDAFDINIESAIRKALVNTNWKVFFKSGKNDAVNYKVAYTTPYSLLETIKTDYDLEVFYNTKENIVEVYDAMGKPQGAYFSDELKLKRLTRQGQSYDFCTVLYPIGKDGLTIGVVNNGINLLENYTYCNKYIPKYWIQEDIEYAEQLKMAATAYLEYYSTPIVSYSLLLSSLPKNVSIGDTILLVDKNKRIKQKQRVVKMIRYPFNPEKDKVEISNQIINFADTFVKYNSDYEKQLAYIKKNLATLK